MVEVRETEAFKAWRKALKDPRAQKQIVARLTRLTYGLMGDVKPVGEGVSELRIHVGPGYRIYIVERQQVLIIVLTGGDKASQAQDIEKAKALAREI